MIEKITQLFRALIERILDFLLPPDVDVPDPTNPGLDGESDPFDTVRLTKPAGSDTWDQYEKYLRELSKYFRVPADRYEVVNGTLSWSFVKHLAENVSPYVAFAAALAESFADEEVLNSLDTQNFEFDIVTFERLVPEAFQVNALWAFKSKAPSLRVWRAVCWMSLNLYRTEKDFKWKLPSHALKFYEQVYHLLQHEEVQ